jgi:hypothetical protein
MVSSMTRLPAAVSAISLPRRSPGSALDQPGLLEPVEAVGHAARGDHRGLVEPGGREHVGRARPSQRREHVELARLQPGLGEQRIVMIAHHALGGLRQAAEQRHRQRGQVGALACPLLDRDVGAVHGNLSR